MAHRLHLCICNGLGLWFHSQKKKTSSNFNDHSNAAEDSESSDDEQFRDVGRRSSIDFTGDDSSITNDARRSVRNRDEDMDIDPAADTSSMTDVHGTDDESQDHYTEIDDNWSRDVVVDVDPSDCSLEQDSIGKVMNRCRSFIRLVNKSSILKTQVNRMKKEFDIKRELQLDCKSRWNSSHRLIETMLMYRRLINRLNSEKYEIGLTNIQTKKLSSIELDKSDWILIESLEYVLRPFIETTKLVGGQKYSTIGMSFFAVVQINDFLEDTKSMTTNHSKITSRLKDLLLHQIEKYFVNDDDQWNLMKVRNSFTSFMDEALSFFIGIEICIFRSSRFWCS